MRRPAKLLGVGTGIAMLLAMPLFSPSRALGMEWGPPVTGRGDGGIRATPSAPTLDRTYGKLPMSFEKNAGQSPSRVDFIARGAGYGVFLTPGEAILALRKQPPSDRKHIVLATQGDSAAIRMTLVGSSPARAAGEDELPGKANYFIGNEPAKWKTEVPTFAKVRYPAVYPGIDVLYYGNQGRLEYDFIVAPGADPEAITLAFRGATVVIEKDGDLVLATAGGAASMRRPLIYQEVDGARRVVAGGSVKRAGGRIGFAVGPYDTARPLVIDPVLLYSTYLGGSSDDVGSAIAVDPAGNAYITGWTTSSDFPTHLSEQAAYGGGYDAFVAKIDPSGSALVYSTYFGGNVDDYGTGIAMDASGQAYVAGRTNSSNFPTTPGAYQTAFGGGGGDAFVAKFSSSGSALSYSTYLGRSGYDAGTAIGIDASGNAYVTGHNYLGDFPTTTGAYQTATNGAYDAFVSKLNPAGSALVYSTYLGGNGDDGGLGIAVDLVGNAYVTGQTNSSNFPMQNPRQGTFGGYYDAFVTKINPGGSALVFSTYLGGAGMEFGRGIAVDPLGNAYIAGQTGSGDFPTTPGAYQTTYGGSEDAFVAKINSSGSVLVYSTYLGGSGGDAANAIAVDPSGNAYVTGNNYLGGFPTKNALQDEYHAESYEAFVAKMASDGALVYSTYLGGTGNDLGLGIAADLLGNAYVVGYTQSTDFPTTPGAYQETNGGIYDAFVAKIAAPSVGKITGGGSIDVPGGLATFGFTVRLAAPGAPIQGDLQYVDHATKTKVHSVTFTSFSVADTTATFGGTCIKNRVPCTFTVEVTDNGEPGVSDAFTIKVSGEPTEGGTVRSGNIQIHQ